MNNEIDYLYRQIEKEEYKTDVLIKLINSMPLEYRNSLEFDSFSDEEKKTLNRLGIKTKK